VAHMTEGFVFDSHFDTLYCIDRGGLAFLTLENIEHAEYIDARSEWAGGRHDQLMTREQARAILTTKAI